MSNGKAFPLMIPHFLPIDNKCLSPVVEDEESRITSDFRSRNLDARLGSACSRMDGLI